MKVFEIVEAPGDNWTGRSAGGIIVPGGSAADARFSGPANRTPSNTTPATPPTAPKSNITDLRVTDVRGEPNLRFTLNGKRYQGTATEVMDALESDGNPRAATAIQNKNRYIQDAFKKYETAIKRSRRLLSLLSLIGAGAGVWAIVQERSKQIGAIDAFFKDVYMGGSFDQDDETYQRMVSPHNSKMVKELTALIAGELVQFATAGALVKLVRWTRLFSGAAASTGVGIFVAAIGFVAGEGIAWLVEWAIKKYGPAMVEELVYEAINSVAGTNFHSDSKQAELERAAEEVRAKARQDRADQARQALRAVGQSSPAIDAPDQSDTEFNKSLDNFNFKSN